MTLYMEHRSYDEALRREREARWRADHPCALWPTAAGDHVVAIFDLFAARVALERAWRDERESSPQRFGDDLPPLDLAYLMGLSPPTPEPIPSPSSASTPRRGPTIDHDRYRRLADRIIEYVEASDVIPVKRKHVAAALGESTNAVTRACAYLDDQRVVLVPGTHHGLYRAEDERLQALAPA